MEVIYAEFYASHHTLPLLFLFLFFSFFSPCCLFFSFPFFFLCVMLIPYSPTITTLNLEPFITHGYHYLIFLPPVTESNLDNEINQIDKRGSISLTPFIQLLHLTLFSSKYSHFSINIYYLYVLQIKLLLSFF